MEIFDVMRTARAMRYLRDEPVADELVQTLLWAATRAPSPGNSQLWHFILVTDKTALESLGAAVLRDHATRTTATPPTDDPSQPALRRGAQQLFGNLAQVPLLVVVAAELGYPPGNPVEHYVASTTLPAAQNLLLAARSLGLGATFTTMHHFAPGEFHKVLELPDHVRIGAVIPVGWPAREFGPVRRRPVEEFVHYERWYGTGDSGRPEGQATGEEDG